MPADEDPAQRYGLTPGTRVPGTGNAGGERYALFTICVGAGQGITIITERV